VNHPNIRVDLDSIERTKGVTAISQRDLEHPPSIPLNGFAFSDFPPSAATVSASSMSL
jgi:hypothetical protein